MVGSGAVVQNGGSGSVNGNDCASLARWEIRQRAAERRQRNPGRVADLLVLDANPRDALGSLVATEAVSRRGRYLVAASLRQTQLPFTPSTALHLPAFQASSLLQTFVERSRATFHRDDETHRPAH